MKKIAVSILLLLPGIAFGQLFPTVPDFKGNIEKVVEKRYGKEVNNFKLFERGYNPNIFSGWKYIYLFDENSKLARRTNTFQGVVKADYLYQRETIDNKLTEREIVTDKTTGNEGDYIEYENYTDSNGHIEKVNFRAFNARECKRELYQTEQNALYDGNKLISFTRNMVLENGDTDTGEKCNLYYDTLGKLARIERNDMESGFKTIIQYSYNDRGLLSNYSVDFLADLQEYGKKNQIQDIFYKYDRQGNWIRMYWKSGKKYQLEAKRFIKYR